MDEYKSLFFLKKHLAPIDAYDVLVGQCFWVSRDVYRVRLESSEILRPVVVSILEIKHSETTPDEQECTG